MPPPASLLPVVTPPQVDVPTMPSTQAILVNKPASGAHPGLMVRLAGDRYVQLEYGPMELDVNLR